MVLSNRIVEIIAKEWRGFLGIFGSSDFEKFWGQNPKKFKVNKKNSID